MALRIALAVLALLLAMPPAAAASFDCARASTAFERAICDNPELSRQDEILAKAYQTALGGLSKAASAAVQKGQRGWLAFAERACTDDAEPRRQDYGEDDVACLTGLFANRIRWLEESRMREGRRIYQVDRYIVMPDPDATAESFVRVATKALSSPRIDGTDAEAAAFNAVMDGLDRDAASAGQVDMEIDALADPGTDVQMRTTVEAITDTRISLLVNDWWYGHGAAHGNYIVSRLHFLTGENRMLEAADIFAGDGWQETLAALVLDELDRMIEGGVWEGSEQVVAEAVADPQRWSFAETGLTVQFQPYEVTAYAYGAPEAMIPWDRLREHLAEGADAIVGTW